MKISKKFLILFFLILFPLLLLGYIGYKGWGKKPETAEEVEPTPEETYVQLSLEERPFVNLTPDSGGRELSLAISGAAGYELVEYEIVYFSKDRQLGLVGELEMAGQSSVTKSGLTLGSCSRGVCTYDPDVNRGNLTLRFRGQQPTKLKTSFRLEEITGGGEIASIDEKATVKFSKGSFYVILMGQIGFPNKEKPEGEILAGPYSLFSPAKLEAFKVNFDQEGQILGWNDEEEAWEEITSGESTKLTTFVLVGD